MCCLLGYAEDGNGGMPPKLESNAWSVEKLQAGAPKSIRAGNVSKNAVT